MKKMESPFSSKEKGNNSSVPPRAQMEGFGGTGSSKNSLSEDPFNFSELMNFDSYAGWFNSPSATDQMFASFSLSSFPSLPYASFDLLPITGQSSGTFVEAADALNGMDSSYNCGDKMVFQQTGTHIGNPVVPSDAELGSSNLPNSLVSGPTRPSLDEKMLRALSLLKESSGGGILAQVWVPIKHGDQYMLTTSEQPYLLDQMLSGYREVSRTYIFSAEKKPGSFPGLPGRVFISRVPEWTSDVIHYSKGEYLRFTHAVNYKVRGSIALPIFEPPEMSCCAVLELVTMKEKPNFDSEMKTVSLALQAVNLRTIAPRQPLPQCLSGSQRAALAEITDVLRAVCHAHRLPLALTWIPCYYTEEAVDEILKVGGGEGNRRWDGKRVLCVETTACYRDAGFCACMYGTLLEEGQGIAGKVLRSNHPFFSTDVKTYDISDYPLVHHARKCNLNAAVAIRLRSTYTGDDDYILELFLPINLKGGSEQQLLLNNLSGTMQRICRSLRTVSDVEIDEGSKIEVQRGKLSDSPSLSISRRVSETELSADSEMNSNDTVPLHVSNAKSDGKEADGPREKAMSGPRRQIEKKRSTAEKNVTLSVLQPYFSGSLKDAAKSLGGTVMQEVDTQKTLVLSNKNLPIRISEPLDLEKSSSASLESCPDEENSVVKLEEDECSFGGNNSMAARSVLVPSTCEEVKQSGVPCIDCNDDSKSVSLDAGSFQAASLRTADRTCPGNADDEINIRMEADDGNAEHNHQPTYSSMTDSSDGSGSMSHGSSSSSQSFDEAKNFEMKTICVDSSSKITVKATYKDDTVRFKFEPSAGCFELYEEIARRFKLQTGTFQLKYLDDEEEWVMLVSDSDLQECLEVMEYVGTHNVKFQVRDVPCAIGSSGGSNCFLGGS
ncbi:hypothetical protein CXB51_026072 [Gossypium anomalum]|uniref:PB1 domain-containing protein n=1 Tax=Gossypium anomalum TaxID=47600 RepID=A0A8J6CSZ2_9ROSI|nr:hypothetical protein CXB51_026072 [Gossypium anomalum]